MRLILAAALIALPPPLLFSQAGANPAAEAVAAPTAAALARALAPADLMIPVEIEVGRKAFLALPTLDADAKALEAEYPGIWQAIWTDIEPKMRESVEAGFPEFWSRLEKLYASRLTEAEAQAILVFYRSPTGQKMLRTMVDAWGAQPVLAATAQSATGTITAEQMKGAGQAARMKAVRAIGPADEEHLDRLKAGISLEKFQAVGVETQRLTLAWVNEEDPEFDAQIGPLIEAAMEKYIAKRESGQ